MNNNDTEKTLEEIMNEVKNLQSIMKRMSETLDKLVQYNQLIEQNQEKPF